MDAALRHVHQLVPHREWNRGEELLQVHVPLLVHHLDLVEEAVHVALQLLVLVNLAIAELLDGSCKKENLKYAKQ